jgi:hypothetical protein
VVVFTRWQEKQKKIRREPVVVFTRWSEASSAAMEASSSADFRISSLVEKLERD